MGQLEIRNLRIGYRKSIVIDRLDLTVAHGTIAALLGPSGAGKTTLLKLISAQLRPDAGRIEVEGQDVHALSRAALYRLRTRMGMLFQNGALLTHLSVLDNVAYPLREHTRLPESMIRSLVLLKLEAVGLRGARDLMPGELSGGMARRVALARAVALDPTMVLYDEPFTGQDPISKGVLVTLVRQLNDAFGLTSILVSHDVEETLAIADYVYLLAHGRVIARGTPAQVRETRSPWVEQFLGGLPDGPVRFHYPAPEIGSDLLDRASWPGPRSRAARLRRGGA